MYIGIKLKMNIIKKKKSELQICHYDVTLENVQRFSYICSYIFLLNIVRYFRLILVEL